MIRKRVSLGGSRAGLRRGTRVYEGQVDFLLFSNDLGFYAQSKVVSLSTYTQVECANCNYM
jgi:hypothetical protein